MAKRVVDFSMLPPDTRWTDPQLMDEIRRQQRAAAGRDYLKGGSPFANVARGMSTLPWAGSVPVGMLESAATFPFRAADFTRRTISGEVDPRSQEGADLGLETASYMLGNPAPKGSVAAGRARMRRAPSILDDVPPPGIGHNRPPEPIDASVGMKENAPVMFRGKEPYEFDPEDWHAFGLHHGTSRPMGPSDEAAWRAGMTTHTLPSGRTFQVPGGTDPFTYYDTLFMKSQGVPTRELAKIDPAVRQMIHDRMAAGTQPFEAPAEMAPHSLFNKLVMGMESPNNPLTPNQLAFARTMAKGPEDLSRWAAMIPWRYGAEGISKEQRLALSNEIADRMGINAATVGGLGARGTTDYTRIAELAQMVGDKPDFFRFKGAGEGGANPSENWANFVQRISSQVPGLSAKTGSFGSVWQDPVHAATSAIDRHMVRRAEKGGNLFASLDDQIEAERLAANRYFKNTGKSVENFEGLPQKYKDDAYFGYLNRHPATTVRTAKGELNPKLPEGVLGVDWVKEPKKVETISAPYRNVQEVNRQAADQLNQGLFSNQWFVWDDIRNRLEPHENMNPALEQVPRMSLEQTQRAREAHRLAGYLGTPGKPVGVVQNPSSLAFFSAPGVAAQPFAQANQQPPPGAPWWLQRRWTGND